MTFVIRPEKPDDLANIDYVTTTAFRAAPHTNHREQLIVNALRNSGALRVSLVAEKNGNVVGHVAVSPVNISDGTSNWYGLGPISVLPGYQRHGIGSQLIRRALSALQNSNAGGCVVLGEPDYYRRFGFRRIEGLVLRNIPAEYFQARLFDDANPRGIVTYHKSFSA